MSCFNFEELEEHVGHNIHCVYYGLENDPVNVSCECEDCNTVILDYDADTDEFESLVKHIGHNLKCDYRYIEDSLNEAVVLECLDCEEDILYFERQLPIVHIEDCDYMCEFCQTGFMLVNHDHENGAAPHFCPYCGEGSKWTALEPMSLHDSDEYSDSCPVCDCSDDEVCDCPCHEP